MHNLSRSHILKNQKAIALSKQLLEERLAKIGE